MISKLKRSLAIIIATLAFSVPVLLPATSLAACSSNITSGIESGIQATGSSTSSGCSGTTIQNGIASIAKTVVNVMSVIVGVIAVIMIIYAGFKYITSGGESNGVTSAKNSLIYAIVGLVIVALAQIIVHLVLNTSSNISNSVTGLILFR